MAHGTDDAEAADARKPPAAMQRILLFLPVIVVALLVLGSAHYYFVSRLVLQPQWGEPLTRFGSLAGYLGMALLFCAPFAERTLQPSAARFIAWPAAIWMGIGFYLLLCLGISDAVLAIVGAHDVSALRLRAELVIVVTLSIAAIGLRSGLGGPVLKTIDLQLPRWPAALDGYRIAQISDIHIGPTLRAPFAQRIVTMVQAAKPDLIAVTGDLVDGSVAQLSADVAPFAALSARDGTFFITGNHDFYSHADPWTRKVTELGMRPLRNTHAVIDVRERHASFVIAGVDDPTGRRMGGTGDDVSAALEGVPQELAVILLAHDPKTFERAKHAAIDLQLSGHTHGGQMWPFSYLVRLATRFVAGHYELGHAQLYVSLGTGFWGPPLRILAPAEVTLLRLHPRAATS